MENRKYKVSRDNIYVGEVVRAGKIYRYKGDTVFFHTKPGQLDAKNWFSYRSMLFVPNEEELSNDLLYRSPSYPILNVTDDETCLGLGEKSIIIINACNLAALLKYFGYNEDLTFKDVMRIRKTFFTGRFGMDNCELFGRKENKPGDWTYYDENGVEITDPKELKRRRAQERRSIQAGHRSFREVSESVLPREYWNILYEMGDNDLMNAIEWNKKKNAFAPHEQEGPVKKLTRF